MMRRLLALILCLVLCLSLFPASAFAEEEIAEEQFPTQEEELSADIEETVDENAESEETPAEEPHTEESVAEEPEEEIATEAVEESEEEPAILPADEEIQEKDEILFVNMDDFEDPFALEELSADIEETVDENAESEETPAEEPHTEESVAEEPEEEIATEAVEESEEEPAILPANEEIQEKDEILFVNMDDFEDPFALVEETSSLDFCVIIDETSFPDDVFRNYVAENFDTDSNGRLSSAEIAAVTFIDCKESQIYSLEGIEWFTSLTTLYCQSNRLYSLDLRNNTALTYLDCQFNQISVLDFSENLSLQVCYCGSDYLTQLNLGENVNLTWLKCFGRGRGYLPKVDIGGCPKIVEVYRHGTKLKGYIPVGADPAQPGGSWYYWSYSNNSGDFCVDFDTEVLTNPHPTYPVITTQPTNQSVSVGDIVEFFVTASGTNRSYQWQYKSNLSDEWTDCTGPSANNPKLSFIAEASYNGYQYRCLVSNGYGTARSSVATLTVEFLTGWQQIDGKWYYFNADGTPKTGWLKSGSSWFYLDPNTGAMATGWVKVGSTWYYMNSQGVMQTGWQKIANTWYYFKSSGAMATGWQKIGNTWYYFKSSGAMATGWQKIGNTWYYFKSSGAMATGWQKIGNAWYYFQSSGAMKTGWLKDGGKWYYLDSSGAMLANTSRSIGGKVYYFNSSGVCTNP